MKYCGKDYEEWLYDEDGVPTQVEHKQCDSLFGQCEECSAFQQNQNNSQDASVRKDGGTVDLLNNSNQMNVRHPDTLRGKEGKK